MGFLLLLSLPSWLVVFQTLSTRQDLQTHNRQVLLVFCSSLLPLFAYIRLLSFFLEMVKEITTFLLRTLLEACCFIVNLHNATFKFTNNTLQNLRGCVFLFNFACWQKIWLSAFLIFWRKFCYVKLSSHRVFSKHKTISNGGVEYRSYSVIRRTVFSRKICLSVAS